ncbi:MAG: hypothetical protein HY922_06145 [Elusimicrobia bacterium]|nr:hypothetical protein [Elusimicrobiota bacterium]
MAPRHAALSLALLASWTPAAASASSPDIRRLAEESTREAQAPMPETLTAGRYRCVVKGILCEACKRAILRELRAFKELSESKFDEENPILWLKVAKGKSLRVSRLSNALRTASRRMDLGTKYSFLDIRYVP